MAPYQPYTDVSTARRPDQRSDAIGRRETITALLRYDRLAADRPTDFTYSQSSRSPVGSKKMSGLALERVIYASTATQGFPNLQSIAEIIAVSDRNNRRDDITGALVIGDGIFLQVLEGARQDLNRTLGRIVNDPRHVNLRTIDRRAIKARAFAEWGMVGAAIKPKRDIVMSELIAFSEADPTYVVDRILAMLAEERAGIKPPF